jgi:hypothetical protein
LNYISTNLREAIMKMVKLDRKIIPAELSKVNRRLVELNGISRSLMVFCGDCGETLD